MGYVAVIPGQSILGNEWPLLCCPHEIKIDSQSHAQSVYNREKKRTTDLFDKAFEFLMGSMKLYDLNFYYWYDTW